MWKKLVDKVRLRVEKKAPQFNLREALITLGEERGESLDQLNLALEQLLPEQLRALTEELWDGLGQPARELLAARLQQSGQIACLRADLTSTNKQKQASAASLLGKLRLAEAIPDLVQLLASSDLSVVLNATAALANFQPEQTLSQLLTTLEHPQCWPPARVADVIVGYGPVVAPTLVKTYWQKTGHCQELLIEILGQLDSQEGLPAICGAMGSAEATLRQQGARAAGKIGGPLVAKPLQELLKDAVPAVRAEALEAIALMAPSKAQVLIRAALLDPDRLVRSRAAGILAEQQEIPRTMWAIVGQKTLSGQDQLLLENWLSEVAVSKEGK